MTDIRERLARAISGVGNPEDHWFGRIDQALDLLSLTQAQLEGLASGDMVVVPREPSKEMIGALNGGSLPFGFSAETVRQESVAVWQAMISAAQEEQP